MAWQKRRSDIKYKNRFMMVTEDELVTDHGDTVIFGIVHKDAGVCIIPWDGNTFTLVRQYRYAVSSLSWEFPAGHMEHNSVQEAAEAELREEAGLVAGNLEKIGEFFIAPGHNTQVIHFYLATNLSHVEQELETAEKGMIIRSFTHEQLNKMIKSGDIKDSLTIAALKFFELHTA